MCLRNAVREDDYEMKVNGSSEEDSRKQELCMLEKQLQCLEQRLSRGGEDDVIKHYRPGGQRGGHMRSCLF